MDIFISFYRECPCSTGCAKRMGSPHCLLVNPCPLLEAVRDHGSLPTPSFVIYIEKTRAERWYRKGKWLIQDPKAE